MSLGSLLWSERKNCTGRGLQLSTAIRTYSYSYGVVLTWLLVVKTRHQGRQTHRVRLTTKGSEPVSSVTAVGNRTLLLRGRQCQRRPQLSLHEYEYSYSYMRTTALQVSTWSPVTIRLGFLYVALMYEYS